MSIKDNVDGGGNSWEDKEKPPMIHSTFTRGSGRDGGAGDLKRSMIN